MSGGVHNPANMVPVLAAIEINRLLLVDIQAITTDTNEDLEVVDGNVDAIRARTDAMGVLENTGGELTTDGTEQNVYINNAPAGEFEPRWFNMDFANQTVTETILIRVYYRILDGGPWVVDDREEIVGVPVNAGIWVALKPNRFGVRVTVERTAGAIRTYDWEVHEEV